MHEKIRILANDMLAKLRYVRCSAVMVPDGVVINHRETITLQNIQEVIPESKCTYKSNCSICLSTIEINNPIRIMKCNHHYHTMCIDQWLIKKATCPECRYHFATNQIDSTQQIDSDNDINNA